MDDEYRIEGMDDACTASRLAVLFAHYCGPDLARVMDVNERLSVVTLVGELRSLAPDREERFAPTRTVEFWRLDNGDVGLTLRGQDPFTLDLAWMFFWRVANGARLHGRKVRAYSPKTGCEIPAMEARR